MLRAKFITVLALTMLLSVGSASKLTAEEATIATLQTWAQSIPDTLGGVAGLGSASQCEPDYLMVQGPNSDLQPGVREFIANTYMSHAAEFPDPNEPLGSLQLYLKGRKMLQDRKVNEAVTVFKSGTTQYPDSRHAHAGLGWALRQKYQNGGTEEDLRLSTREFIIADEIGMKYGKAHYTHPVAIGLAMLKDRTTLGSYFEKVIKDGNTPYLANLDYAQAFSLLQDPSAETWYKRAMAVEPKGVADALAYYAEWLLDHNRETEVVDLINNDIRVQYVHFLKGLALERLGRQEQARQEYGQYRKMSAKFPAPARYRIQGSESQTGLIFQGDIGPLATESEAVQRLSRVISGEARGESVGGQRAVGWTVRTRVFRAFYVSTQCGGYPTGVWGALSSGSPLPDKYIAISNASGQFVQYDPTPSTNTRADEVYYGLVLNNQHIVRCFSLNF